MSKAKRPRVELRYYEVPQGEWVLPLLGDSWKRNYGNDTTCQHFHNLTEIGVCHYGDGKMQDAERAVVPYGPGTLTLFPANVPHNTISTTASQIDFWEYLFLDVPALMRAYYGEDNLAAENFLERMRSVPHVFAPGAAPELFAAVHALMEEMRCPGRPYGHDIVKSMATAVLLLYARIAPAGAMPAPESGAGEMQIRPALSFVSRHYAEPIRVEDMAASCHLSETHFRRVFFEATNLTPLDYLSLERVQRACELLQKTDADMAVVAAKTGFISQTTFNRTFRKLVGTTPYHWKRTHRAAEASATHYYITAREGWK